MKKQKILIIEDEYNIVELIKINLENSEYEVVSAYSGMEGISKVYLEKPDLILLDLNLPDLDGFEICNMIKTNENTKNVPIIMLTARSEEDDKVKGFTIGADDYITKPFGVRELEARIANILRRSKDRKIKKEDISSSFIEIKDIKMDFDKYEVIKGKKVIDLTPTEFKILKILMQNKQNVTSRQQLLDKTQTEKSNVESRILDVHIRNLRKKLKENTENKYIETIRGIGYKFKVGN